MSDGAKAKQLFGLGDGDRIRLLIDRALLDGDLMYARELSDKLTFAINYLAQMIQATECWEVIFAGGDDICFTIAPSAYRDDHIQEMMKRFSEITGGTISFGVGPSIETAYVNLSRAKARGCGLLVASYV